MSGNKIEPQAVSSAKVRADGITNAGVRLDAAVEQAKLGKVAAQLAAIRDVVAGLGGLAGVERIPGLDIAGTGAGAKELPSAKQREVAGIVPGGHQLAGQWSGPRQIGPGHSSSQEYQTPDGRTHWVTDDRHPNSIVPVERSWTTDNADGSYSTSILSYDGAGHVKVVTATTHADGTSEINAEPHDPNRHPPMPEAPPASGSEGTQKEPKEEKEPKDKPAGDPARTVTGDEPGGGATIDLRSNLPLQDNSGGKKLGNDQVNPGRGSDQTVRIGGGMRIDTGGLVVNPSLVEARGLGGKPMDVTKPFGPGARPPGGDEP